MCERVHTWTVLYGYYEPSINDIEIGNAMKLARATEIGRLEAERDRQRRASAGNLVLQEGPV